LNNSGGLGLTGGIADVGGLYDALAGIHEGRVADADAILDKYDEVRRQIWHDIINPMSSENMQRLYRYSTAEEAMEKDPFFKSIRGIGLGNEAEWGHGDNRKKHSDDDKVEDGKTKGSGLKQVSCLNEFLLSPSVTGANPQ